jgi:hypothetical protein
MAWSKTLKIDINILILKVTCSFWLLTKILSRRIWMATRLFPTAPVFKFFDHIPSAIHLMLFIFSILFICLLFFKMNRWLMAALLITEAMSCLLDINRLLPWEYLYAFIIFIFLVNRNNPARITACVILLLVSTYFYSGLCKLNNGFLHTFWANVLLRHFLRVPQRIVAQNWVYYSGYILGITELMAGIGLLFVKTRTQSAILLILTHIFILLLFSPFGLQGFRVLWPWNISMILLLCIILYVKIEWQDIFSSLTKSWNKLVLVCWVILPAFSFFGLWDRSLSSNLFSANVPRMIICIRDTSKCRQLQGFYSKIDITNTCHGQAKIDIQRWIFAETGVTAYPQMRTYKIMQEKLEQQYTAAGLSFVYLDR